MNLLIMGPPGVGKGTQAKLLKTKLGLTHISTGKILRSEIEKKSEIGIVAKRLMDKGNLAPDQILLDIIKNRISSHDCDNGYLLDGFPRTLPQAQGLEKIMAHLNHDLDAVINLIADENELVVRILERRLKSGRSDDTLEILKKRQEIYWEKTAPLVEFYSKMGKLKNINGLGEINLITERILKEVV